MADASPLSIDLVVPTVGRRLEIERFLDSVVSQTYRDVRVLIVDQNDDDRLDSVVERLEGQLSLLRLRSGRGLSRARNVGLAHASGDVIAFPDDDCLYPPTLLEEIARALVAHPEWAGMSVRSVDSRGRSSSMLWDRSAGPIGRYSVWRRAISIGIFLRSSAVEAVGGFSEELGQGAGTPWGSGEESDFLLRVLEAGHHVQYVPSLYVNHESPQPTMSRQERRKAYEYGLGHGRVLRLHGYPAWFAAFRIAQLFAGSAQFAIRTRVGLAQYYFAMARGRADGWRLSAEDGSPAAAPPQPVAERDGGAALVEADGKTYLLDAPPGDYIGELVKMSRLPYEHELLRALRVLLPTGGVVVDVGANIGNHAMYFAAHGFRVHAFEANPEAVHYLRQNVVLNRFESRVTVHPVAAGDRSGTVSLAVGEYEMRLGMTRVIEGQGDVPLVRLDDVLAGEVALIKIDVEGAEAAVVRGAGATIARSKPVIVVETQTPANRRVLDVLLRTHHRFPLSFYGPPTYVYVPQRRDLLRLARQWRILGEGAGRLKHRLHSRGA